MNKNPLNINSNQHKWETPSIYPVKMDKYIITQVMSLPGEDGGGETQVSYRPDLETNDTGVSTYSNPFDYNSFDENPFAE